MIRKKTKSKPTPGGSTLALDQFTAAIKTAEGNYHADGLENYMITKTIDVCSVLGSDGNVAYGFLRQIVIPKALLNQMALSSGATFNITTNNPSGNYGFSTDGTRISGEMNQYNIFTDGYHYVSPETNIITNVSTLPIGKVQGSIKLNTLFSELSAPLNVTLTRTFLRNIMINDDWLFNTGLVFHTISLTNNAKEIINLEKDLIIRGWFNSN